MTDVGFEPTPPKRLVPKTSALDHSANQSITECQQLVWGISSIGRVRRSQRRGSGIEARILQLFFLVDSECGAVEKFCACRSDCHPLDKFWRLRNFQSEGPVAQWIAR